MNRIDGRFTDIRVKEDGSGNLTIEQSGASEFLHANSLSCQLIKGVIGVIKSQRARIDKLTGSINYD